MKKLLKPLKPLLYAYLRSDAGKRMVINILKALTNIQTHVVNVLQSYQKLYEEDKSEVELEKTG